MRAQAGTLARAFFAIAEFFRQLIAKAFQQPFGQQQAAVVVSAAHQAERRGHEHQAESQQQQSRQDDGRGARVDPARTAGNVDDAREVAKSREQQRKSDGSPRLIGDDEREDEDERDEPSM